MSLDKASKWLSTFREQDSSLNSARTIAVTGGKGGVGKTSMSLKLSLELSKLNKKVLLIDCDYNLSNTLIKLELPLSNNFYDLLTMRKSFEQCLIKRGDFHLLAGCNGNMEIFEQNNDMDNVIIEIINAHRSEYDYIILDCPAGLTKLTVHLAAYCDTRIFITNPDKSSVTDSYSLMKILKNKFNIDENHLIVNKFNNKQQFIKVIRTLSETAENFLSVRTSILGGIVFEENLSDNFDNEFLYREKSSAHKCFLKVLKSFSEKVDGDFTNLASANKVTNYSTSSQRSSSV